MPTISPYRLPFDQAIEHFRSKLQIPATVWSEILDAANEWAFYVSGVTDAQLLADIYEAVDKVISEGLPYSEFADTLEQIAEVHGWRPRGGVQSRARRIFDTNNRVEHAAGRYQQMLTPFMRQARPYWQAVHRTPDDSAHSPRPAHQALNGTVMLADEVLRRNMTFPCGFGCRCFWKALRSVPQGQRVFTPQEQSSIQDPLTGESVTVPAMRVDGQLRPIVEPGFNYNPGLTPVSQRAADLANVIDRLPPAIGAQVRSSLNFEEYPEFSQFVRDKLGRFAKKAGAGAATEKVSHLADHLGKNVVSWKVGKVVGGAIAAVAAQHGVNPEAASIIGEASIQALTATALYAASGKRTKRQIAETFVAEGAAAIFGKLNHTGAYDLINALGGDEDVKAIGSLFAGKATGVATNAGVSRLLAKHGDTLSKLIAKRNPKLVNHADSGDDSGLTAQEQTAIFELSIAAYYQAARRVDGSDESEPEVSQELAELLNSGIYPDEVDEVTGYSEEPDGVLVTANDGIKRLAFKINLETGEFQSDLLNPDEVDEYAENPEFAAAPAKPQKKCKHLACPGKKGVRCMPAGGKCRGQMSPQQQQAAQTIAGKIGDGAGGTKKANPPAPPVGPAPAPAATTTKAKKTTAKKTSATPAQATPASPPTFSSPLQARKYNPDAIEDLSPEQFGLFLTYKARIKANDDPDEVWNKSLTDSGLSKANYQRAVLQAIDGGLVPSDEALAGVKLNKKQQAALNKNRQEIDSERGQVELIQKAIDHPLVTPAEKQGYKPVMTESEAANYTKDSWAGGAAFYHGNGADVIESMVKSGIDPDRNSRGIYGKGAYFANSKEVADQYAGAGKDRDYAIGKEPAVLKIAVNVKNPYVATSAQIERAASAFSFTDPSQSNMVDSEAIQQWARARGHDSIYLKDKGYFITFDQAQTVITDRENIAKGSPAEDRVANSIYVQKGKRKGKLISGAEQDRLSAGSETSKKLREAKYTDGNKASKYTAYQIGDFDDPRDILKAPPVKPPN